MQLYYDVGQHKLIAVDNGKRLPLDIDNPQLIGYHEGKSRLRVDLLVDIVDPTVLDVPMEEMPDVQQ